MAEALSLAMAHGIATGARLTPRQPKSAALQYDRRIRRNIVSLNSR